jgi:hypothetical protein
MSTQVPDSTKKTRAKPLERKRYERRVQKIREGMLISRLEKIALGKVLDAQPHQVTAALGLLKKVCPDLAAIDHTSGGEKITIERTAFKP